MLYRLFARKSPFTLNWTGNNKEILNVGHRPKGLNPRNVFCLCTLTELSSWVKGHHRIPLLVMLVLIQFLSTPPCRRILAVTQTRFSGCLTLRATQEQIWSSKTLLFASWASLTESPTRSGWVRPTWTHWWTCSAVLPTRVRTDSLWLTSSKHLTF